MARDTGVLRVCGNPVDSNIIIGSTLGSFSTSSKKRSKFVNASVVCNTVKLFPYGFPFSKNA
jgi:hypothetical protein